MGPSNQSLWKELGVNINRTWFQNPTNENEEIYVFADVPRLLKLVRNHFLDSGFLFDNTLITPQTIKEMMQQASVSDVSIAYKITDENLSIKSAVRRWLYVHLLGQVLVVLWTSNFYHMVVDIFIPTAGRSGGSKNPDIMIAIICSSLTFFITSYLSPLIVLLKKSKNFLVTLFAIYVVTRFYFIAFTNYGFPYTDESTGAPKVQRHHITHAVRTLHDKEGNIRYTDSGFWFRELDRNALKTIESLTMPDEPIPQDQNILCKNEVFCGLPFYSSRQMLTGGYWIPGPAPLIRDIAHLKLLGHEKISTNLHRMNFLISGSFLMSLQIRPKDSVRLYNWNILKEVPPETTYNEQKSYFVMITNGLEAEPMNITLEFKTTGENHKRSLVDITLVTLHWEFHKDHTPTFANLLLKVPRWAFVVPSVAAIKSWTF